MKKILITGGFGFLGSHLIDTILEHTPEAQIVVVDDLSSSVVNPKLFMARKPISFAEATVREYCIKSAYPFSEIYHLASPVGPVGVLSKAGKIADQIVSDAASVARLAQRNQARLVFVSTSEVYGGGQGGYCSEEMPCIINSQPSARLEYATGKLAAEVMLLNQANLKQLDLVVVRPFNIAGARQSPLGGFVLPRFIKQAQDDKNLPVYGDGSQVRAMTDVRDVAEGIYLAMLRGESGEVYNIGNENNKVTIKELAERVITYMGKGYIEYVNPKDLHGDTFEEANDKYPDSKKARIKLGWQPKYELFDLIQNTLAERHKT